MTDAAALSIQDVTTRGNSSFGRWLLRIWVLGIYAYLLLCMLFGGPFTAFDHVNYIAFLNDPKPFSFEPGYTLVAYFANALLEPDDRFPAVFLVWAIPPLIMAWRSSLDAAQGTRRMLAFACVITKGFVVGFITQRFFFAELWLAALLIQSESANFPRNWLAWIPGLALHFSSLVIVPSRIWMRTRITWSRVLLASLLLFLLYLYVNFFSNLQFFVFDYSRYIGDEAVGSWISPTLEMGGLAGMCLVTLPRSLRWNAILLCCFVLAIKLTLAKIEVLSRVFQIEADFLLIIICLFGLRLRWLAGFFAAGFGMLQAGFSATSADMAFTHILAISNAISSVQEYWRLGPH